MSADNQQERTQEGTLRKYRVMNGRFDRPETLYTTFQARSDEEAKERFEEYKSEPSLQWDRLRLVRVDQEEITSNVDSHGY
jgi:hypothetical protein